MGLGRVSAQELAFLLTGHFRSGGTAQQGPWVRSLYLSAATWAIATICAGVGTTVVTPGGMPVGVVDRSSKGSLAGNKFCR